MTLLLLGLPLEAAAAGPELTVGVGCSTTQLGTGATVTVPVSFTAGIAAGGQPNAVSAIDMVLTFAADAFTVVDVRLPGALASQGAWTLDWERTLGLAEKPGRVGISLAPAFQFPVPTLPDGTVVELVLSAMTNGQSRCIPIEIATDSLVLSSPPLGLPVTPGSITDGGVTITEGVAIAELCQNCTDDDGDGLVDLADPDCGAAPISFAKKSEKVTVIRKRNGTVLVKVRGSLPKALGAADPVRIELRPDDVTPLVCSAVEAPITRCTGKKKKRCIFGASKLIVDAKKQQTTLVATLSGLNVPSGATALSLSVSVGAERFYASISLQKSPKKAQTYK